jgi:dihydroflavonol-4-reductase
MDSALVLVTGGSGVVGGGVLRRLVADGRRVRALARSERAAEVVAKLGAEPVRGDILDVDSLAAAMAGCEVVYHVAGVNQFCSKDPTPMERANVTGSTNCVMAASRTGVRRLVYTSSAVTLGEEKGTVGREDSPHRGTFLSAYERSKFEAEETVFRLGARLGIDVVSVNPSSVQGPGRVSGTGQVLVYYLRGRLKFWVDTTISLVDIDDCAEGHVLAESKGEPGQRYVLNGASLGSAELLAVMGDVAPGVGPPRLVPAALAAGGVVAVEFASRVRRRPPLVCRESLRALLHGHRYDGSRAERELGLRYRTPEETIRRTALWLVEQGQVPASAVAISHPSNE